MKHVLLVSFDYARQYEDDKSYSVACLTASIKRHIDYKKTFIVHDMSIPMSEMQKGHYINYLETVLSAYHLNEFSSIAISVYIWNNFLVNDLISLLKSKDFYGNIILGGNQISCINSNELYSEYPLADIFIQGYGEASLLKAIFLNKTNHPVTLKEKVCLEALPSVYTTGELSVVQNQEMVRLESRRGCPYNCSFCAFPDTSNKCVKNFPLTRVFEELEFLKSRNVGKVNFLDPVFNHGKDYLKIIDQIIFLKMSNIFSFQTRFELINGQMGEDFLNKIAYLNAELEFGLQTISALEMLHINRNNNLDLIRKVIKQLNERNICHEESLIYGLPFQTPDSLKKSIDWAYNNGCKSVKLYPLMLLRGTELYDKKEQYKLVVENDEFNIPIVVSGNSFSRSDYDKMKQIAITTNKYKN